MSIGNDNGANDFQSLAINASNKKDMKTVVLGGYSSKNDDLLHNSDTQNFEFYQPKNIEYQNGNNGGILKSNPDAEFFCCAFCKDRLEQNELFLNSINFNGIAYICTKCDLMIYNYNKMEYLNNFNSKTEVSNINDKFKKMAIGSEDILDDYEFINSDRFKNYECHDCKMKLKSTYLNVNNQRYHIEHFNCSDCKIPLYTLGEYFVDPTDPNKYYCDRDYLQRFAHLCFKCELPITVSEMIVSLDRTYHPACFVCSDCQLPFEKDLCFEYKGYPLCERHWHNKNGTICPICDGIIKNKCVIFDGYKYHDDCFLNQ
ncbi:Paxillin-like protein [Smittium culicis]|uniref:Paxillin-like protein n=1 Tax=Smittium culicis TaxID=133412 RepID=A0A1R1X5S8_9FUNG|nr:Paxillin-like protein [Smittium culicis]OMJ14688.1 Paxillin-like protein [Smittium culicis]